MVLLPKYGISTGIILFGFQSGYRYFIFLCTMFHVIAGNIWEGIEELLDLLYNYFSEI